MDIVEAVELVGEDYRSNGEEWADAEIIAHVQNTISLNGETPGAVALVDYNDKLTEAYRTIILMRNC